MSTIKVLPLDLRGEIKNFPIEVVQKMCDEQVAQGNEFNPEVFAKLVYTDSLSGGFRWFNSEEGYAFWDAVIRKDNFDLFFTKYPKTKL